MSISYGNSIPRNGLLIALDAANPKSYPGSGSTWYNLTGNSSYNATIYSSPHTSDNGGVFNTTGVNESYIHVPINMSTTNYTIVAVTRYSGTIKGRIVSGVKTNWLLGHHSNSVGDYYAQGWIRNNATTDNNWHISIGTGDISGDKYSFYFDGEKLVTDSASGAGGPNLIHLGKYASTEFSEAQISYIGVYNRVITDTEAYYIWNGLKGRYGL